jgi:hypothetical protein
MLSWALLVTSRNPAPSAAGSKPGGGTIETCVPGTQTAPEVEFEAGFADARSVADAVGPGLGVPETLGEAEAMDEVAGPGPEALQAPRVTTASMAATALLVLRMFGG